MPQHPPFSFAPGRRIGRAYRVESRLGAGTEGEVYSVREDGTNALRAAKIFYPTPKGRRASVQFATKLESLRQCDVVLQYYHTERIMVRGNELDVVISELCAGRPLQEWVDASRGRRLPTYVALRLLYELAKGLEQVHAAGQYHSDVHTENIMVSAEGVNLRLKLIDFYEWGRPTRAKMQEDVFMAARVLYEILGGGERYARSPKIVKDIVCGQKRSLIGARFPTASALRVYLENRQTAVTDLA